MTYNTKAEFMAALKSQAEKYSLSFGEMAEDFERHFSEGEENGETESEICAKLGDPVEIVKEYVGENSENVQCSNSNEQNITAGVNRVDSNTGKISGGMITGVILLDLFVLDWALPTLASLVIVYIAVAFAFIVSGVVSIIPLCYRLFLTVLRHFCSAECSMYLQEWLSLDSAELWRRSRQTL